VGGTTSWTHWHGDRIKQLKSLIMGVIGRVHDPRPGWQNESGLTYLGSEHAPGPCLVACLSSCSLAHALIGFLFGLLLSHVSETCIFSWPTCNALARA
jgi:hypothetical protein